MNEPGASLRLDARALERLSELLDLTPDERTRRLAAVEHDDPMLHQRVVGLLQASAATSATRQLNAALAYRDMPTPAAGDCLAGYSLIRELGRGGMATVWLARRADGGLEREVALKLPLMPAAGGAFAERFERERDVLAALDHPNIARLFDAGVDRGRPYIVLEAVNGLTIVEHADKHGLSLRQRLALGAQVLAAVSHAHRHMVVHRDLKPSNILVDHEGRVKLLDFGIAKLLAAPAGGAALTQDIGAVLTPRYAAPELLRGHAVTAQTDIYAAGVVLYELLTGRWPYRLAASPETSSLAELIHAANASVPLPPGVSTDVDTVLLKALAKDPADRYASIDRLADDVQRLLDDRPILARRVPAWRRIVLLLRRHPRLAFGGGVAALIVGASIGVAALQWRESTAQRERADAVRQFVFTMVADAQPPEGRAEVTGREMVDAAVTRARRDVSDPRLRAELLGALGRSYSRLRHLDLAAGVLGEAVGLLEPLVDSGDPPLNIMRAELARSLLESDSPRADRLARMARDSCSGSSIECAKARAIAYFTLTANATWQGRQHEALTLARASAREAAAGFGANSLEAATALEVLASSAHNRGKALEAAQALDRARGIAAGRVMRAADRDRLDLVQAVIDTDLGRYEQARTEVRALLQRSAGSYERALQWRVLSGIELLLGHPEAAMAAADDSLRTMPPDSPALTPHAWLARQAWARAASRAGRHDEAVGMLQRVRDGLLAEHFAPTADSVLATRRAWAEALLRRGSVADAARALEALAADHARDSDPHAIEFALVEDALACSLARRGDRAAADAAYDSAARRWAATLPAGHPYLQRNQALRFASDCVQVM